MAFSDPANALANATRAIKNTISIGRRFANVLVGDTCGIDSLLCVSQFNANYEISSCSGKTPTPTPTPTFPPKRSQGGVHEATIAGEIRPRGLTVVNRP